MEDDIVPEKVARKAIQLLQAYEGFYAAPVFFYHTAKISSSQTPEVGHIPYRPGHELHSVVVGTVNVQTLHEASDALV